jgi:hypothetical protein
MELLSAGAANFNLGDRIGVGLTYVTLTTTATPTFLIWVTRLTVLVWLVHLANNPQTQTLLYPLLQSSVIPMEQKRLSA